jgi:hypothetical protein
MRINAPAVTVPCIATRYLQPISTDWPSGDDDTHVSRVIAAAIGD